MLDRFIFLGIGAAVILMLDHWLIKHRFGTFVLARDRLTAIAFATLLGGARLASWIPLSIVGAAYAVVAIYVSYRGALMLIRYIMNRRRDTTISQQQ